MKKVLYIDPLSSDGHLNFNSIYIDALKKQSCKVKFIFKQGYHRKLGINDDEVQVELSEKYFRDYKCSLLNKYYSLLVMLKIKREIRCSEYDCVLFASYETLPMFLSRVKGDNIILVNHNNIRDLDSIIKAKMFKFISRKCQHIVFEKYIEEHLQTKGIRNVVTIPHGLPEPYVLEEGKDTNNPIFDIIYSYSFVVFSPSSSSVDKGYINSLINNIEIVQFLEKNDILLIIKGGFKGIDTENIKIIDYYLSDYDYKKLFLLSNLIMVTYPKNFKYRVSAVFFECIANNKTCILSDIKSLKCYKDYVTYNPYVLDGKDFISRVKYIKKHKLKDKKNNLYTNVHEFVPNMNSILKKCGVTKKEKL